MSKLTLWVARDKVGILHVFNVKPSRVDETWKVDTSMPRVNSFEELKEKMPLGQSMVLFSELFPNLKWEDEPLQVELNEVGLPSVNQIVNVLTCIEDYQKEVFRHGVRREELRTEQAKEIQEYIRKYYNYWIQ